MNLEKKPGLNTVRHINKRQMLGAIAAGAMLNFMPNISKAEEATKPLTFPNGTEVEVEKILNQKISKEYMDSMAEHIKKGAGIVVSKSYHMYFLIKRNKTGYEILNSGPVGTANPNFPKPKGGPSETPTGTFPITIGSKGWLIEGEKKSWENGEILYNPLYYNYKTGHAIHGSVNFFMKDGKLYVLWDNSHGCVNIPIENSKFIMDFFQNKYDSRYTQVTIVE